MPSRSGNIARVTVGYLNRVSDEVIGMTSLPLGPGTGKYPNQLGAEIELSDADAAMMSDPAIGTLYGGVYRYVRFRLADVANTFKRGMVVLYDSAAANQVTSTEALATAYGVAGITINPTTGQYAIVPGRYGWIYAGGGRVAAQWKAALTVAAAVGMTAQWSAAGAGADNGTIDSLAAATANSTAKYIGQAEVLPVAGSITNVWMPYVRRRIVT
jgi:hypothetical protein